MANWQPTLENKSIKKFSKSYESTERLDAEYYQPKYDELMKMIKKNKYTTLGELVKIRKSIEPGSEAYQSEGIPFLRVANISKYEISDTAIYLNEKEFNNNNLKPEKDTILFSKDGSVRIAFKLEENINAITSSALLHLKVKGDNVLPDYLTLVLNSKLVQLQAERDSGGSVIQHWRKEEIENVLIPLLEMDKQIEISNEIKRSFSLRKQSKELLERAKKAVEIAIEEGEEKAFQYIKIS
ncbi:MAG: restriction endonuclease subunit S [Ignavibacteria bacterium]|nr:restriction endonuclease subunit S [Ignavibacteria bacterium]